MKTVYRILSEIIVCEYKEVARTELSIILQDRVSEFMSEVALPLSKERIEWFYDKQEAENYLTKLKEKKEIIKQKLTEFEKELNEN